MIYYVEDDMEIRNMVLFTLETSGLKARGFIDSDSLFKELNEDLPDLIMLDIMLPNESGNEIVRKLRKNQDTKKLPVIMVTAKTTELDLVKGLEDGETVQRAEVRDFGNALVSELSIDEVSKLGREDVVSFSFVSEEKRHIEDSEFRYVSYERSCGRNSSFELSCNDHFGSNCVVTDLTVGVNFYADLTL